MLVSVGLVGKVPSAVSADMWTVARVDIHVVVVALPLGEALLADPADKGPVRVGRVVGQDVVLHLVLVALLTTVVAGSVDVDLVGVVLEAPLALELHPTLPANVCLL